MVLDVIDRVCKHAYTLGLVLAALTFSLMPLHLAGVQRGNVTRVHADNRIEVNALQLSSVDVGEQVKIWRFNPDWLKPIGGATAIERTTESVILEYDPAALAWPMGRQGTVVGTTADGRLELNLGSEVNLKPGDQLVLFDERSRAGRVQVADTEPGRATARILQLRDDLGDKADPKRALGLTATEFTIPNQITSLRWSWLPGIEAFLIALGLGLWGWSVVSPVPGRWLSDRVATLRAKAATAPRGVQTVGWLLLGIPACFVGLQIAAWFWFSAPQLALNALRGLDNYFPILPVEQLPARVPMFDYSDLPLLIAIGGFVVWLVMLAASDKHPLWDFLQLFRFRREDSLIYRLFGRIPKGFLNWTLHLIVFYMFAINLMSFLENNMAAAARAGWPGIKLPFHTVSTALGSTGYMLTHAPTLTGLDDFFVIARYLTWSACIVGCLFGYGHTIVSILWKKAPIRWIDFTIAGWFVNLLCYGAWANAVFRVFPHPAGHDPAIVGGPLMVLQPTTELYLNLVYTLSIFNMGKKFGVMVDKGMVERGFYSVVRHPSYTLEPLMFSVLFLNRVTAPIAAIGLLAHPFMYWMRSERDDHFMGQANPNYAPYREKVPWKFIPGVW